MNVRDIMTSPAITIKVDATVEEAAEILVVKGTSCLPVVDNKGDLVGILTHTDFGLHRKFLPLVDHLYTLMGSWVKPETLEEVARTVSSRLVKDVMSHPVITIQEDAPIADVANLMLQRNINRLPVMQGKQLVGMVTRHDLVKLMIENSTSSKPA